MFSYSTSAMLTWQISAVETYQARHPFIEREQLMIGLLKVGDVLDGNVRLKSNLEISPTDLEIIEKEINIKIDSTEIKFRAAACFYVKKEAILRHDLSVYKNWYAWLMDMKESSGISSRVFEYCWHIIFTGKHIDNYLNF